MAPQRHIKIIEQNINLNILTKTQVIEGTTSIRISAYSTTFYEGVMNLKLCAKQLNILSLDISDLSMFNPLTKDNININTDDYIHKYNYPSPDTQIKVLKHNLNEKCPKSTSCLSKMSIDCYEAENEGYLKIFIKFLGESVKAKVADLYKKGYNCYFTCKINYENHQPMIGGFFKVNKDGSVCFIKENKTSYTRNIIPCLDGIDDYYKIGHVKIKVDDPEMTALTSGT